MLQREEKREGVYIFSVKALVLKLVVIMGICCTELKASDELIGWLGLVQIPYSASLG